MAKGRSRMLRRLQFLALILLSVVFGSPTAFSQAGTDAICSTTSLADAIISGSAGEPLVNAVAQSVPTDPVNCVPSYCAASFDESNDKKVAIGAGLSEAYSRFVADGNDDWALGLLSNACSADCEEVVVTAFAASQSTTVPRLCDTALGGASGVSPNELKIDAGTSSGGGQAASGS